MSVETTRKSLVANYGTNGLAVGYCDAWALLRYEDKKAHTGGVYGWNFDAYDVEGVLICTGYRGMIGKKPQFLKKYEQKARAIVDDWNIPYQKKQRRVHALLLKWVKKEYEKKN